MSRNLTVTPTYTAAPRKQAKTHAFNKSAKLSHKFRRLGPPAKWQSELSDGGGFGEPGIWGIGAIWLYMQPNPMQKQQCREPGPSCLRAKRLCKWVSPWDRISHNICSCVGVRSSSGPL